MVRLVFLLNQPHPRGRIDFERVFSAIEKSAYSGWVGAEYKPVGTTADSLGWLRKLRLPSAST
jgi:hydroxypyruvate isomerase